ncbi:MAG: BT_2262 family domain-containing protein [Rikenellaceae bacterium]
MKKILYKIFTLVAALSFVACGELSTEGISTITYFVVLELEGGDQYVELGSSYTDPGFTATEDGVDVASTVETSGDVNTSKVGVYPVSYYVENSDGYSTTASRNVFVYDPAYAGVAASEITGTYTLSSASYREITGSATQDTFVTDDNGLSYSNFVVTVSEVCTGVYFVSDFSGAWFKTYKAYGSSYNMSGYITLDSSNVIEPLYFTTISGWEAYEGALANGTFDEATSTLTWDYDFGGEMAFHIELTK